MAWGRSFMDERGHISVSAEVVRERACLRPASAALAPTAVPGSTTRPATASHQPDDRRQAAALRHPQRAAVPVTKYGLITQGPLQGTAFGKDGVPYQFQYGSNGVPNGTGGVTGCITPLLRGW